MSIGWTLSLASMMGSGARTITHLLASHRHAHLFVAPGPDQRQRRTTSVDPARTPRPRSKIIPVLVGGGIPFFPQRERRVDLELVETRTFSSRVVYLSYRVAR
jgi:hypothetical protein